MLKGPHSSVSCASDLQSRGPGFDPQSGRGIVISEILCQIHMLNICQIHMNWLSVQYAKII